MRLDKLFEDLDDQDQFGPGCGYCMMYGGELDLYRFHEKHEQAEIMAERASNDVQGGWRSSAGRQKYHDIFNIEMWRFGYVRQDDKGPWTDRPLKESLEDADQFGYVDVVKKYRRTYEAPPQSDPNRIVLKPRIIDYIYEFEDGALLFYEKHIQSGYAREASSSRVRFKSVDGGITDLPATFQGLSAEYSDGMRNFRVPTIIGPASWRQELDSSNFGPEQDKWWREVMR